MLFPSTTRCSSTVNSTHHHSGFVLNKVIKNNIAIIYTEKKNVENKNLFTHTRYLYAATLQLFDTYD